MEEGFAFAGVNAYRADKIISVKELIEMLVGEYMVAALATEEHNMSRRKI